MSIASAPVRVHDRESADPSAASEAEPAVGRSGRRPSGGGRWTGVRTPALGDRRIRYLVGAAASALYYLIFYQIHRFWAFRESS